MSRLSDVVKGVKNMKLSPGGAAEKEENIAVATGPAGEIVVSAADRPGSPTQVVSVSSPTKNSDGRNKDADLDKPSSHTSNFESQKNFRDIGVGSADDNHEIRSSQCK